jgi:hypothetical protein
MRCRSRSSPWRRQRHGGGLKSTSHHGRKGIRASSCTEGGNLDWEGSLPILRGCCCCSTLHGQKEARRGSCVGAVGHGHVVQEEEQRAASSQYHGRAAWTAALRWLQRDLVAKLQWHVHGTRRGGSRSVERLQPGVLVACGGAAATRCSSGRWWCPRGRLQRGVFARQRRTRCPSLRPRRKAGAAAQRWRSRGRRALAQLAVWRRTTRGRGHGGGEWGNSRESGGCSGFIASR